MNLRGRPGIPNTRPVSVPVSPVQAASAQPRYVGPTALFDAYYRVLGPDTPIMPILGSMQAMHDAGWKLALGESDLSLEAIDAIVTASTEGFRRDIGSETARQILAAYGEHGCKIVRRMVQ